MSLKEYLAYERQQANKDVKFIIDNVSIRPTDCIADLGCEAGWHARALKRNGYSNIVGLDWEENNFLESKTLFRIPKNDVAFVHADWKKLPFRDSLFDFVLLLRSTISDDEDQQLFQHLKEVRRTIKSGGSLLFTLGMSDGDIRLSKRFGKYPLNSGIYEEAGILDETGTEYNYIRKTPPKIESSWKVPEEDLAFWEAVLNQRTLMKSKLIIQEAGFSVSRIWDAGITFTPLTEYSDTALILAMRRD